MDRRYTHQNKTGSEEQQQQQQRNNNIMNPPSRPIVNHFADVNTWQQQPSLYRHSSANQQYNAYSPHQEQEQQYTPATSHYAHQSQSSPNASMNTYAAAGVGRYLPQSKGMIASTNSLSPRQNNSNKVGGYPSSSGFEHSNGVAFVSSGISDNSSSSDHFNITHEDEGEGSGMANQHNLGPSPLRRGQACAACRRRKLKCNAVRPICGTCNRSRKAAASANHPSPIPDGDCVYDDGPASSVSSSNGQNMQGAGHTQPTSFEKARRASSNTKSSQSHISVKQEKETKKLHSSASMTHKRRKTVDDVNIRSPAAWDSCSRQRTEERDYPIKSLPDETAQQKSKRLENRIRELENMLEEKDSSTSQTSYLQHHGNTGRRPSSSGPTVSIISLLSPSSGREEKYRMQYSQRPAHHPVGSSSLKHEMTSQPNQDVKDTLFDLSTDLIEIDRDEQIRSELAKGHYAQDDPILQLLWPGWSTELPSPDTVLTICETFFRQHPMRSLVYKPSFMSGLSLPPNHPHRPHDSLIHAMLATTADISPFFEDKSKDTQDRFVMLLSDARFRPGTEQKSSVSNAHLSFKEFHLRRAREKVEHSLITEFRNPLDWIASCLLSCYTLWSDFRVTESYFLSAILARAASPSGLDKLPSRHFLKDSDTDRVPGLFGLPEGVEEQERRMTFWHIFITDQYTGGTPLFYENLVSEASILTHLPCTVADYQAGKDVAPNPQTLSSPDLFRSGHIDDFTLHIKSAVLVRRACTLQCRNQLTKKKPTGLAIVDKQISEFIDSFPPFDFENPDQISIDKLTAWNNIWLALFHLHESYLTPTSIAVKESDLTANYSIQRVSLAVDKVLGMIHYLMNSSFDFALLHPQTYLTWSVCARMLGKEMDLVKRNETQGEAALQLVTEKLHWIVMALERAGEKNLKARRCSELVSYVRSGALHEGILSQLLYTDGVIPTGEEDNTPFSMTSAMTSDTSLDALMLPNNSNDGNSSSRKENGLFPQDFSMTGDTREQSTASIHQQSFPDNDMLLNFAI